MSQSRSALDFVSKWVARNVHSYPFDDVSAQAQVLAHDCMTDAENAGFDKNDIEKAIGGDLSEHMLKSLGNVHYPEVDHRD